ncbi:MAG: hypothetical protein WBC73_17500, partial [Phormidesmis sp.]
MKRAGRYEEWNQTADLERDEDEERRHWDYHYDKIGDAPGTLVIDEDASPTELTLIDYGQTSALKRRLRSP